MKQTEVYINKLDEVTKEKIAETLIKKYKNKLGFNHVKFCETEICPYGKNNELSYVLKSTKNNNIFDLDGYVIFDKFGNKVVKGKVKLYDYGFDVKIGNCFVLSAVEYPDHWYIDSVLKNLGKLYEDNTDVKYLHGFLDLRDKVIQDKIV